jgi:hypothetical protein
LAPSTTARRRILLASLASLLVICGAAGGATWYATRCDRNSYLSQAATSWVNDREQYLFACGQVWHSLDAGQTWQNIPSGGLPLLAREGRIAEDRSPGQLYLAMLLAVPSSLQCPLCPLTQVQPTMFVSVDGGRNWQLVHRFPEGPAGLTYFRSVSADPEYSNAAWVELVARDEVFYWGTNSGGREWAIACTSPIDISCSHLSDFSAAPHAPPSTSP